MTTDDITNKLKDILLNMNSNPEYSLENFYDIIERETGGKLTFSSFKNYLEKYYSSINKSKK